MILLKHLAIHFYECIEGKKDWQYIFESTEKDKITGASLIENFSYFVVPIVK